MYLDDWLIRADSPQKLMSDAQFAIDHVSKLGCMINTKKSELVPTQAFQFLGMLINLRSGLVRPTLESRAKIRSWCVLLRQYRRTTARMYLSFLGVLAHAADFVPLGRLYTRPLQFYLQCFWKRQLGLEVVIVLNDSFFQHLSWWEDEGRLATGVPLTPPKSQLTMFTDASNSGWGAFLAGKTCAGQWSTREATLHINCLEMLAVHYALQHFRDIVSQKVVLVMTDNTTVVSHIRKQGGTRSLSLCTQTLRLFELSTSLGVTLQVCFIAGKRNVLADQLSRKGQIQQSEWMLAPNVFRLILKRYPALELDLFATRWTHQLPKFVSPFPDDLAWATDALSISWDGITAYAFPPTTLIAQVLDKVQSSEVVLCLVAPKWPTQAWYATLLKLLVDFPLKIPICRKLLQQPNSTIFHSTPTVLNLHVWLVSRMASWRQDFLRRLQHERLDLRDNPLLPCTSPDGESSVAGVIGETSIPIFPLYSR